VSGDFILLCLLLHCILDTDGSLFETVVIKQGVYEPASRVAECSSDHGPITQTLSQDAQGWDPSGSRKMDSS
jgi:hypothetical protein